MGNCVQREIGGEEEPRRCIKKRGSDTSSTTTSNQINTTNSSDDDGDNKNSSYKCKFSWTKNTLSFSNTTTPNSSTSSLNDNNNNNNNNQSSSSSTSSPKKSRIIDGKHYVSKYPLLEIRSDIDTLTHYVLRYLWDNNFSSPVDDLLKSGGGRVLDIGCGSGTWILEMSYDYPSTSFVGIGTSPIFPNNIKPQNVEFLLLNTINDGLPFEDNKFDFIHMRMMGLVLVEQKWPEVLNEIARILKPGGWFECMESGGTYTNPGPIAQRVSAAYNRSLNKLGINSMIYLKLPKLLEDLCQFSIVEVRQKDILFGEWKNYVAELMKEVLKGVMGALKSIMLPELKVTGEEYDSIINNLSEVEMIKYKTKLPCTRICSRKIYDNSDGDNKILL